jgi:hypothetical protein
MGCFGCCKFCAKSAAENSDLGSVVYFKILKSLLTWLFIMMILNAAIMGIHYLNNPFEQVDNYLDLFFKFSVGNLDSSKFFNPSIDELQSGKRIRYIWNQISKSKTKQTTSN